MMGSLLHPDEGRIKKEESVARGKKIAASVVLGILILAIIFAGVSFYQHLFGPAK